MRTDVRFPERKEEERRQPMTAFIIGVVCFFVGLSIGSNITGKVAYEEGVTDERRKWYIHAHCYHWKEEDFNQDNNNLNQ